MDKFKKLTRVVDSLGTISDTKIGNIPSDFDYEEAADFNNGSGLLRKALKDPSMKEVFNQDPYKAISNGKFLFVYAEYKAYWSTPTSDFQKNLESEGWTFAEQSNQNGKYMWNLYKKESEN